MVTIPFKVKFFFLSFLLFGFSSAQSQTVETSILNRSRTYEVTATLLPPNKILAVWMEARPSRKTWSQAGDMRVAYKISTDLGKHWSPKKIIDSPETLLLGNPYLTKDGNGNVYLVLMQVNTNFFSGNLSFYAWDKIQKEFKLKSIPASFDNNLLDKPAMVFCGNDLFLIYVDYSKTLDKGKVKIQRSADAGLTWSDPKTIFPESDVIALGPSISCLDNTLLLSYGLHWRDSIYFTKRKLHRGIIDFPPPKGISEISDTLVSAMTLMVTNNRNRIAIGWEYIHKPNEIYISLSNDGGKTWNTPLLVTKSGNLLSMDFNNDNNNLCLVYDEFDTNLFSVVYEELSPLNGSFTNKLYVRSPTKISKPMDYIGAFQKIISAKNNSVLLFWIDFSNGNKLYFSTWNDSK